MQDIPLDHTPIIKMLSSYLEKEAVSFHMPGHTNGELFSKWLHENALAIDTTELDLTDDLNNPGNAFREASIIAAEAFGASETFFITTGATTAVYASLLCTTTPEDKIILYRNVHKSVLNACMLFNLHPIFTAEKELDNTLALNPDAVLVFLTRPDYFGRCVDIVKITASVHKAGMILIVDEAHGTHFSFCSSLLPVSAVSCGADVIIHSAHKTAPALTQGAFVHISHEGADNMRVTSECLKDAISIITTSSPSFLIAATCDFARAYLQEYGDSASFELFSNLKYLYSLLSPEWFRCIERYDEPDSGISYDPFRLVIKIVDLPFTSAEIADELTKNGIYIEFYDLSRIVMICKFGNKKDDFILLAKVLNQFLKIKKDEAASSKHFADNIQKTVAEINDLDRKYQETFKRFPVQSLLPNCGLTMKNFAKSILLKKSVEKTLFKAIIPYPPGVPLVWPGEVMDAETIVLIEGLLNYGLSVNGIDIYKDEISGEILPHVSCLENFE